MRKSTEMLDWMIKVAGQEDLERKIANRDKPNVATGESWWVYHLKNLKELIILENAESGDNKPNQEKSKDSLRCL